LCLQINLNLIDEKSTLPLHERRIVSTSFCDFYIKKRRAAWGQQDQRAAWERKSGAQHRACAAGGGKSNAKQGAQERRAAWGKKAARGIIFLDF